MLGNAILLHSFSVAEFKKIISFIKNDYHEFPGDHMAPLSIVRVA